MSKIAIFELTTLVYPDEGVPGTISVISIAWVRRTNVTDRWQDGRRHH